MPQPTYGEMIVEQRKAVEVAEAQTRAMAAQLRRVEARLDALNAAVAGRPGRK